MSETNGKDNTYLMVYDKHTPTYEEVKAFIGGWLEAVQLPNGDKMILDEEGKLKGLEVNFFATVIWHEYFGPTDTIVGPVAIIRKNMRGEDW